MTGATGLVGQFLIKDLLFENQKLAILVRPSRKQSAVERVESILQRWEKELGLELPRPVVFEGDLTNGSLSLNDEQIKWVKNHCDRIIHNAAVLTFNGVDRNDEPWTTNLTGTKNVLQFCNSCEIDEMHYVSTAYVSGVCDSIFYESQFDMGQDFRNDYERSKFEAEKLVRDATGFKSKTIYRPAVISGDSSTGFTPSYHGVYVYLRLMATMIPLEPQDDDGIRRISIKLPMQGDEPRNLVPVDWVSTVMTRIICNSTLHNETYHLVPQEYITARNLVEYSYEYFNSTGTTFAEDEDPSYEHNKFASTYLDNMSVYSDYEQTDPKFDYANVLKVCGDLPCPKITKDIIFKYYDFGVKDCWGKRKPTSPEFSCWMKQNRSQLLTTLEKIHTKSTELAFGLNLLGPGGGQWTVVVDGEGNTQISIGISQMVSNVYTINQNPNSDAQTDELDWGRNLLAILANLTDSNTNPVQSLV